MVRASWGRKKIVLLELLLSAGGLMLLLWLMLRASWSCKAMALFVVVLLSFSV